MSRRNHRRISKFKKLMIASILSVIVAIAAFAIAYTSYNKKISENLQSNLLKADDLTDMIANQNSLIEDASTKIGKTVEESKQEDVKETPEIYTPVVEEKESVLENATTEVKETVELTQEEKAPDIIMPVEGDIVREFAKENLLFSQTLDEWVTHLGIDIKADKATVVKASADGKITAIKNDPRYGLTVVIEHTKGFKTIYSNLLTAEYVKIGENVVAGQTIGTVGNTATFEILDEPHLHFEMILNDENVNPTNYIK